ncbi:putative RNA-directed DNA polymerase, eukaryota, reverse transcriptase zinc-binding domain protein [Tanacetum coccineum]
MALIFMEIGLRIPQQSKITSFTLSRTDSRKAKKAKKRLMILKVDFEKAFDSLNWSFLFSILEQMGFSAKWRNWIHSCLNSAYASILVNGSPTKEFKIERGLRQGDPLSPFLFILAVEELNVVLLEATNNNVFHGFHIGKEKLHISHLQFVDDALIMGNYRRVQVHFASTIGALHNRLIGVYLGLPIGAKMSRCHHWNKTVERFQKRLSKWKSKSLSFGGRVTLIKSVLGSLEDKNISWIAWDKVIEPCDRGGLDIGSLRTCTKLC